ncbi:MAG: DMT family transporter [Chloroflexi bacterium]|nr:MAG: DMT family transporter [Chloroflexota bacterium]
MLNPEMMAVTFGLASAFVWGAGDFSGGVASRRSDVYNVILISQTIGLSLLLVLLVLMPEPLPSLSSMALGAGAGIAGMLGLVIFYRGLAGGRMGIVAPASAVTTAALPVLVGLIIEGTPSPLQFAGFAVALVAVWFLAGAKEPASAQGRDIWAGITSGFGFALFFILIDQAGEESVLWPLAAARLASITLMTLFLTGRRGWRVPGKTQLPVIALTGILDTTGNALFVLASQTGRLDVAAVLASLYPASTVLLARIILKERLAGRQWWGVFLAMTALVLIAV